MTDHEDYLPPASAWVRRQLDEIDAAGGDTRAVSVQDRPVMVVTMTGRRTGGLRRVPLMRVEHGGTYAAIASKGGAPEHPEWFHNLVADPHVEVHDGTEHRRDMVARIAEGSERQHWWERSVAAFPPYADYQVKTDRLIPVFLLVPVGRTGSPP